MLVARHRASRSHPTAFRGLLGAATRVKVCEPADKHPRSAERVEMPLAAPEQVPQTRVVAVEQIASLLAELCGVAKVVA